jgi:hypothetical protein
MGATDTRIAGGFVVWLAVLCACVAIDCESQSEHVHLDRARRRGWLLVQFDCRRCARSLSALVPSCGWKCARLL